MTLYTYTGPAHTTRHGGRLLSPGDEVISDDSLDGSPFFVPAETVEPTEEPALEAEEDPDHGPID